MRVYLLLLLCVFLPFYAAAASDISKTPAVSAAGAYHCPMHPHITGEEGDECPICGMNLMPVAEEPPHMNRTDGTNMTPVPPANSDGVEKVYICPMHPHINGKKGDSCPICGMRLVPKAEESAPHKMHEYKPEGAFYVNPSYKQALGVNTVTATHHDFGRNIRAFGRIAPNMRREYAIDVRTEGWITDLAVNAVGDSVKKGDLLFTYYSPDLMNAQSDFLIGSRVANAAKRLKLYGMSDKAVTELRKRGSFFDATPFYAPADGTVTALDVRKGAYVTAGGGVMTLQDFSIVWVNADVPVRDAGFLKKGTPAEITIAETGKTYSAAVDFIHPTSDMQSRTTPVRLVLDNEDGSLKPGMYADTVFKADTQSRLAVPSEAALYGKAGAYVIEDVGEGYFRPVKVTTGITSDGFTEITDGLSHGASVVRSGQFMLDAESSLKGGTAAMTHDHGSGMTDDTGNVSPAEGEHRHGG